MTSFAPVGASADLAPLDPSKHVNYTLGMVLGVDDFLQEHAYLSHSDRRLAADLIGYGTSSGLAVTIEDDAANGPRVRVAPGVAFAESGRRICVEPAQCAFVNDWLAENLSDAKERLGDATEGELRLNLVLCYRACPTDDVPIPGEPCRSEDDLMAPSRLVDDFTLELRLDPLEQAEEAGVRAFVAWLRDGELVSPLAPGADFDEFLTLLDQIPADFGLMSPLGLPGLPSAATCAFLRAAFLHWVTSIRPQLRGGEGDCGCGCHSSASPGCECVSLGDVLVPVVTDPDGNLFAAPPVTTDQSARPYLVPLRLLQEWLLCGRPAGGQGPAGPPGQSGADGLPGAKGDPGDPGAPGDSRIIAAGRFRSNGTLVWHFGDLVGQLRAGSNVLYDLGWPPVDGREYIVKGTVVTKPSEPIHTFEVVDLDPGKAVVRVAAAAAGGPPSEGAGGGFMVEISAFIPQPVVP